MNNNVELYTKEFRALSNDFSCGNIVIDNFLKSDESLDNNIGVTYVLLDDKQKQIIGYFNIAASRIDEIQYVGKAPYLTPLGGAVKINYLAVDTRFQHRLLYQEDSHNVYIGDYLLHKCEAKIAELQKDIGIAFIYVSSTDEGYKLYHERNFYEHMETDMNIIKSDSEHNCHDLYKCIDDIYYVHKYDPR